MFYLHIPLIYVCELALPPSFKPTLYKNIKIMITNFTNLLIPNYTTSRQGKSYRNFEFIDLLL